MKDFRVEAITQTEFDEAAVWCESQRPGLGREFIAEVDRVLVRIAHADWFATAPIATRPDLEIRQIRRGIMVRARAPWFRWWHDRKSWEDDPMGPIYEWLEQERSAE
ncbi:MAG TPA: hypothetical protein VHT91_16970 [Kofleriaceae bacterium]|nr:hypothetical protein [Kofleriaceae bacterium]